MQSRTDTMNKITDLSFLLLEGGEEDFIVKRVRDYMDYYFEISIDEVKCDESPYYNYCTVSWDDWTYYILLCVDKIDNEIRYCMIETHALDDLARNSRSFYPAYPEN